MNFVYFFLTEPGSVGLTYVRVRWTVPEVDGSMYGYDRFKSEFWHPGLQKWVSGSYPKQENVLKAQMDGRWLRMTEPPEGIPA